jgi:hypothetical protein
VVLAGRCTTRAPCTWCDVVGIRPRTSPAAACAHVATHQPGPWPAPPRPEPPQEPSSRTIPIAIT